MPGRLHANQSSAMSDKAMFRPVPTCSEQVGTVQPIDNTQCSDRSDRSDLSEGGLAGKKGSLKSLAQRLRQRSEGNAGQYIDSETRHVHPNPHTPFFSDHPTSLTVGTVGTVGTSSKPVTFGEGDRSEQQPERSERSEQPLKRIGKVVPIAAVEPAPSPAMPLALQSWNEGVTRLQHMQPLPGFSIFAWALLKRGCAELLLDWGAELERLGWATCEVWGCHPAAPGPAVHVYGLGLFVRDGAVVRVTADGAIIRTAGGALQSYTRRAHPEAVPIWNAWGLIAGRGLGQNRPARAL